MKNIEIARKPATIIIFIILLSNVFPASGFSPVLAQSITETELPELTAEQKKVRLETEFNAVIMSFIDYAKDKGAGVDELGAYLGKTFAPGWEDSSSLHEFVRGMNEYWQIFDIKMEISRYGHRYVKGKRTRTYTKEAFEDRFGGNFEDYNRLFLRILESVCDYYGLQYREESHGDWIAFTIARKS